MTRANVTIDGQAIVAPVSQQSIAVLVPSAPAQVAVIADGPLAMVGGTFAALADVDVANKTDKSVIYYDDTSGKYKADSSETLISLTDGGNF